MFHVSSNAKVKDEAMRRKTRFVQQINKQKAYYIYRINV